MLIRGVNIRVQIKIMEIKIKTSTQECLDIAEIRDDIVVMKDGIVQQIGTPLYLYGYPANRFVAGFIGSPPMNFIKVKVVKKSGVLCVDEGSCTLKVFDQHNEYLEPYEGREVTLGIRPEDLPYDEADTDESIKGSISVVEPLGSEIHLWAKTISGEVISRLPPHHVFRPGENVCLKPLMKNARYFDSDSENSILPVDLVNE